jgi:hypothetical protein
MRRYRERQRAGHLLVSVDIGPKETAVLNRLGYLEDRSLEDRERIGKAICALLSNITLDRDA